ncbi:hypothetical protein PS627_02153 [Pseudomonas fluorescens]|uniref:DUF1145 domain-containing protein n=1 Tax=Pseudomonas fluorescens TaxID=294 RepID=UPI0012572077|nr:DUF1145 domain-containing protein [Pseudomonas fluorescens]CAG8866882.1 hypothetical protein PS627_02153 [Pseudomonas fluorescens]VVP91152.1 hypothetical protein PS910_02892 [Pseudomonas fluorescens]
MKLILMLGKVLTVIFWGVVLMNLLVPQPSPLNLLISAAGMFLLTLHVLEVLFFNGSLRERGHPWFDRLQILLTGIFHIMSIPRPVRKVRHA